jgi:hypothetical protein
MNEPTASPRAGVTADSRVRCAERERTRAPADATNPTRAWIESIAACWSLMALGPLDMRSRNHVRTKPCEYRTSGVRRVLEGEERLPGETEIKPVELWLGSPARIPGGILRKVCSNFVRDPRAYERLMLRRKATLVRGHGMAFPGGRPNFKARAS